jgi:hypothetical protein
MSGLLGAHVCPHPRRAGYQWEITHGVGPTAKQKGNESVSAFPQDFLFPQKKEEKTAFCAEPHVFPSAHLLRAGSKLLADRLALVTRDSCAT